MSRYLEDSIKEVTNEALRMLTVATKALKEIRDTQGKVCEDFELCTHKACQSSYYSWMIADKALKDIAACES